MPSPPNAAPFEIVSSRLLPFPRELVYEAFRDPAHLVRWWGPNGFTNTIHEFDLRVGGAWRITLHAPDGANYENVKEFLEVVPQERVVFRHFQPMHDFTMTMTWKPRDGQTLLTWRMQFEASTENEKLRDLIAGANEQNFDRLGAYLASMAC